MAIYKVILFFVLSLSWLLTFDTQTGYACSGGGALTLTGLIENSDYVVRAHIVEQDDAKQNMIIQVEQYLVGGSGPEYLLLNRNDPLLVDYIYNGRSSGGDCLGLYHELGRFTSFYGFLRRNDDGSYYAVTTLFNTRLYQFASPHSTVEVYVEDGNDNGETVSENYANSGTSIDVTEQEFVDIVAQESGEIPSEPNTSYRYPMKSPLLIRTASSEYVLPIDLQSPIPIESTDFYIADTSRYYVGIQDAGSCDTEDCKRISPDRLNIAVIKADNSISFSHGDYIDGQELQFSFTSDAVAVWNNCNIDIYTTGYPRLNQEWYQIKLVNSLSLGAEVCEIYNGQAAWTPDGRQLAYSDDTGIWLWDVFTANSKPILLLVKESSEYLFPNHFSSLGRYLNFSRDVDTKHIDIVSKEIIADGLISPDERLLINYENQNGAFGYELCSLTTNSCKYGWEMFATVYDDSLGKVTKGYFPTVIKKVVWQDNFTFLQLACVADEPDICVVFRFNSTFDGWYSQSLGFGIDFAYENKSNIIAILNDRHSLYIDGTEIDTRQWFDEEIISIEWLPSLFYQN